MVSRLIKYPRNLIREEEKWERRIIEKEEEHRRWMMRLDVIESEQNMMKKEIQICKKLLSVA